MKNISVALTIEQIKAQTKTVTRRKNWYQDKHGKPLLRVGDVLRPVDRVMGFKHGEKPQHIGEYYLQVVSIRREPLDTLNEGCGSYGDDEMRFEGFPEMNPTDFISMYISANGGTADQMTTRIEFEYITIDPQSK